VTTRDATAVPAATGVLTSRIGRRFVALFAGGALLPLVAFAWLAATSVVDQLAAELQATLHGGARTAGMGIAARLSQVAGDLVLVREAVAASGGGGGVVPAPLLQHVGERCDALWLADGRSSTPLDGAAPPQLDPPSASERAQLAAGRPVVRVVGAPPRLVMAIADRARGDAALVAARIRGEWLWDPEELQAASCRFGAFDSEWRPLFHTFAATPDVEPMRRAAAASPAAGTVEWSPGGEAHVARYWRAFLQPQYHVDLFVVQSRAAADAFAVRRGFTWWFAATAAVTLLLVVLVSLVQMRRTLGPIVALHDATCRVAAGELAARVSITGHDEFAELGAAFNDMTAQLQESVRRRERTELELVASRDAALAAARAKADFVTNVSHELRTPMTELLGAVEILGDLGTDERARDEFTAITLRGAQRLARLVEDVLELDDRTLPGVRQPIDVGATVHAALAALAGDVRSRVRTDVARDLPPVIGDAARLSATWARLLDNAGKFSAATAPIDVRAFASGTDVVVEVEDRGIGVAREDLARIFEPFQQVVRDQLTEKVPGTGLGLTLAKATVERHGGRIDVDSEPGRGTTFRVRLPAAAAVPAAVRQR
jgi:signal transduction histidine kinase